VKAGCGKTARPVCAADGGQRESNRARASSDPTAGKPTNKAVPTAAEPVERRAGAKGNASQQSTHRTQRRVRVSQALERVRQVSPSHTQGGSRVREFRSHGSGRGAVSNGRPYRTSHRVLRLMTHSGPQPRQNPALRHAPNALQNGTSLLGRPPRMPVTNRGARAGIPRGYTLRQRFFDLIHRAG